MLRHEWLAFCSEVFGDTSAMMLHVLRHLRKSGAIPPGGIGPNATPFSYAERRLILEGYVTGLAVGSVTRWPEIAGRLGVTVEWSERGLVAVKGGKVRIEVCIAPVDLEAVLICES
jgi:hypothetical protein